MDLKCIMLLVCLSGIAVLPEAQAIPLRNSPRRLPHHQRPSLVRPNLRPVVPSSPPSPPRPIPISRPLTLVSSGKTTTTPTPSERKNAPLRSAPATLRSHRPQGGQDTPAEKVEDFAKKLRDDMDKQERVLNVFISTIQKKHTAVEMNLKRVRGILSGLRNEIANATKFVDRYQGEERTEAATANLVSGEYTKSRKMYEDEKQNLKFEKEFLDAILRYIKLRKTQKC